MRCRDIPFMGSCLGHAGVIPTPVAGQNGRTRRDVVEDSYGRSMGHLRGKRASAGSPASLIRVPEWLQLSRVHRPQQTEVIRGVHEAPAEAWPAAVGLPAIALR